MILATKRLASLAIALAAGVLGAELSARSVFVRDHFGMFFRRGRLLALVHGNGIYEADVDRAVKESRDLVGTEDSPEAKPDRQLVIRRLIADLTIQWLARDERISPRIATREFNLIRWQFRDEKSWRLALRESGLSSFSLWEIVNQDLRSRSWLSKRIATAAVVTEKECRQFYESHPENFFVPEQLHASHLFLIAPPETPTEVVEAKRSVIGALSVRLAVGEDFAFLAAENSEDEATKLRGGDLGYFTADRMPPDFVAAAVKLRPGEISRPVRTRLGFHVIQSQEARPAHQRSFEDVRDEIAIELGNQKRTIALEKLMAER